MKASTLKSGLLLIAVVVIAWLGYAWMSAKAAVASATKKKKKKEKENPVQELIEDAAGLVGDVVGIYTGAAGGGN